PRTIKHIRERLPMPVFYKMPHAYTKDQQAPRTLTRPLPGGEGLEQPAIGLFAEYSAGPNPHPRPFSHWEKGDRQAGSQARSLVLASRLRPALERLNPALPRLLSRQVALRGQTGLS
ncbi:MAG: hypothetical protein NT167_13115, partial [Verrucomicrobia bacterium]|nr:hypothetical protein [Verrucomicrobiota bacterium]